MQKETVVVIILILLIFIGNFITQKNTKEVVNDLSEKFENIRLKIEEEGEENINKESVQNLRNEIRDKWEEEHVKLAYYIEHDELEKVESNIMVLSSFIDTNDYKQAISKVEEGKFILEHILDKYAFSLENIF